MPSFSKSPPDLVERFRAITDSLPDVEQRQMFGYPALFVGGNLVSGLFAASWFVRVGEPDRSELVAMPGAGAFEPMPGRAMSGYVVLPPAVVAEDELLRHWLNRAIEHGRSLPPKTPKPRRAKAG